MCTSLFWPCRARFTRGEWSLGCFCIFLIRRVLTPDTALLKLIWHNSKPYCAVKSGPLDSKEEKINHSKRKMPGLQKSKNGESQWMVSWQARGVTREETCTRLFLSFCSRNPVVKSPSSMDNYKSSFDSYMLYIFYIARKKEKFPLSKMFTFVNPKRFCWWPCCSWQEFVCFLLF